MPRGLRSPLVALKGARLVFFGTEEGEINPVSRRGEGLYAWDTRHLSTYVLRPAGARLELRRATVLPDGARLDYVLRRDGKTLPLELTRRLRIGATLRDRWVVRNLDRRRRAFEAELLVGADFRDMLEVRDVRRRTAGTLAPPQRGSGVVRFGYTAADGVVHSTDLRASAARWKAGPRDARAWWTARLAPNGRAELRVSTRVRSSLHPPLKKDGRHWKAWRESSTAFASDSPAFDAWLAHSSLDIFILTDHLAEGLFPVAGIPWFATVFGRDSLITAMSALTLRTDLALGVLRRLARSQGTRLDPERDEQPGRIPHEIRQGELVRTGGAFKSPYYGSLDAPPLFVWLAAEADRWMPQAGILRELAPAIALALRWMAEWGDADGDGFIEYERQTPRGIENQFWKDSHDSVLDRDGRRPPGPIAAVEVQAYAFAARARLAEALAASDPERSRGLRGSATDLRERFERAFWLDEPGHYAQALDGAKRRIADVTSNIGHVLWSGVAPFEHGARAAERLSRPDLMSGWGIRTRSALDPHFDPLSYHNGSVWPHDTAIGAAGMARYGEKAAAAATIASLVEAAERFPDHRLPELFAGAPRDASSPPIPYPVACSPQAWTAAAAFLCVRTMLGLEVSADGEAVSLDPLLPRGLDRFEAKGLRVGRGDIDVRIERAGDEAVVALADGRGVRVAAGERAR